MQFHLPGVYRRPRNIQVFIDITGVAELHSYSIGSVVELGGNVSITTLMEVLNKAADQSSSFAYCKQLVSHIDLVANVPVRNNGTVAGNLMIKNQRIEFPSDIFLLLETVGAKVTISMSWNNDYIMNATIELIYLSSIE